MKLAKLQLHMLSQQRVFYFEFRTTMNVQKFCSNHTLFGFYGLMMLKYETELTGDTNDDKIYASLEELRHEPIGNLNQIIPLESCAKAQQTLNDHLQAEAKGYIMMGIMAVTTQKYEQLSIATTESIPADKQ